MRRGFTLWTLLALLVVMFILAAILFPVFSRARRPDRYGSCQSNLKNIGLGIKQYIQDYDERYPMVLVGDGVQGWADAIQPYVKSTRIYQCPSEPRAPQSQVSPRANDYTDYWMNAHIAGQPEKVFNYIATTFMLGDGNDGSDATDARYAIDSVPEAWKHNSSSPLNRHLEGANYAFTDGHVKWLSAAKLEEMNPNVSPAKTPFAFRVN